MPTLTALYIHHLDPIIVNLPGSPLAVRWYGLAYVAGFLLGYMVLLQLSKKDLYCVAPQKLGDFITAVCLCGVLIGGRLGEFFFYWLPEHGLSGFWDDPFWVLRVWEGGMASHGGILAVLTVAIYYALRYKLPIGGVCDGLAIVAPIGLCFGRVANFINGELYGRVCSAENPIAMKFPQEIFELSEPTRMQAIAAMEQASGASLHLTTNSGHSIIDINAYMETVRNSEPAREALAQYLQPRYPSQLFEALGEGLLIFIILLSLRLVWKKAPAGIFSALFCFLYAGARIISECFKEPDAPTWGIITRGQYLSFAVVAMGLGFLALALLRRPKNA